MGIVRVAEMGSDGAVDAYLELTKREALRIDVDLLSSRRRSSSRCGCAKRAGSIAGGCGSGA